MPPKSALREPGRREPERGLRFLEDKLSVYVHGPAQTRRNPALDLLTGRVPDTRFQPVAPAAPSAPPVPARPATVVLPRVAVGVARPVVRPPVARPHAASPWLAPAEPVAASPRLRLVAPPPAPRSPRRFVAPALALAVVCAVAVGVGLTVRSLRAADAETIVVVPAPTAVPTSAPLPTRAPTVVPTVAPTVAPTAAPTLAATTAPSPALADQFRLLVDERFGQPSLPWPNQPTGTAWLADGAYHLTPRQTSEFVAVGVPGAGDLTDVVISGTFTKRDGPDGGGYGLIVRDQSPAIRDGQSQDGRFYVFAVGDRGELGIWLRASDHWLDLLPWTPSDAVHPGAATNELTVSAIGETLSFSVNGIPVASQRDTLLRQGGAGIFTGGDGNHVTLERLTVRVPR